MSRLFTHQCNVDGKLHSDAHGSDQYDHRNGAELDTNQTHDAEQLHSHHGQDKHLENTRGNEALATSVRENGRVPTGNTSVNVKG